MAMTPSLVAILVMFGVMRLSGMMLNVATILIASTVLGTSENDQIPFFYHFLERRKDGSVEQALRHTLRVSGRAILFATLINAWGFLAFAVVHVPRRRAGHGRRPCGPGATYRGGAAATASSGSCTGRCGADPDR